MMKEGLAEGEKKEGNAEFIMNENGIPFYEQRIIIYSKD